MKRIQINIDLHTKDGFTIPSGAIAVSDTTGFMAGSGIIQYSPVFVFKNEQEVEDYYTNAPGAVKPVLTGNIKELDYQFSKQMTQEESDSLDTEVGAMTKVLQWLVDDIILQSPEITEADIEIIG